MDDLKPSIPGSGYKSSLRLRLNLAIVGIAFAILSALLLISLNQKPAHDQLRYSPPATLLAPPETGQ